MTDTALIADVQARHDHRNMPINKVGVKGIKHPILVSNREQKNIASVATVDMYVDLAPNMRGTHMSRFLEVLQTQEAFNMKNFHDLLKTMTERLEAQQGFIDMTFPFFMRKFAPMSKAASIMDYQVSLFGEWFHGKAYTTMKVIVPVTSLCPCSKEISEYGAHNQRSHITVIAHVAPDIWFEDIIEYCEAQASCELYSVLKRADEKYVTEKAYNNPKFVEDLVRDVASSLNQDERILNFAIESENFESIHNHSAYAMLNKETSLTTQGNHQH
jgi:GTP cyclohydrolase I